MAAYAPQKPKHQTLPRGVEDDYQLCDTLGMSSCARLPVLASVILVHGPWVGFGVIGLFSKLSREAFDFLSCQFGMPCSRFLCEISSRQ